MTKGYQTLELAREAGQQNQTMAALGVLAVAHLDNGMYHFFAPGIMASKTMADAIIVEMWRLTAESEWENIFVEVPPSRSETPLQPYDIIGVRWHCNNEYIGVGIVAIRTHNPDNPNEWKAYLGLSTMHGEDAEQDAQRIARNQNVAAWGSPLLPREAHGYFPHLKLEDYKLD